MIATLGAFNRVPSRTYSFKTLTVGNPPSATNFPELMINGCSLLGSGYKPICDDQNSCGKDPKTIFLGASALVYDGVWADSRRVPQEEFGYNFIKNYFIGKCLYQVGRYFFPTFLLLRTRETFEIFFFMCKSQKNNYQSVFMVQQKHFVTHQDNRTMSGFLVLHLA